MGEFLIYKSSAGSGKTTALIQIFLQLSLSSSNPHQFKRVLAITFTNKAADEMRERFMKELHKLSRIQNGYDGGDFMIDWLLDKLSVSPNELALRARKSFEIALQDYDDIGISTIDRFNHKLIRSFSRDLSLSQDFQVLIDVKRLYQDAVELLVEQYGRDERITEHLNAYISYKIDEFEKVNVIQALTDLESLVIDPESDKAIRGLSKIDFKETRKTIFAFLAQFKKDVVAFGKDLVEIVQKAGMEAGDFKNKKNSVVKFFNQLSEFSLPKELPATAKNALNGEWITKTASNDIKNKLSSIEGELTTKLQTAVDYLAENHSQYILYSAILKQLELVAILSDLSKALDELCKQQNLLPIYKFNTIISEVLLDEPVSFIYEKIGNKYDHLLIDEYQDTSEMQWFNLLPLIDESLSKGKSSLVVGDAKQSIYRFRGGKAEQLIALPELINPPAKYLPTTQENIKRAHRLVRFNTNYRSRDEIVSFNNFFFKTIADKTPNPIELYQSEYHGDNAAQITGKIEGEGFVKIRKWGHSETVIHDQYIFEQIETIREKGYDYGDIAILVSRVTDGAGVISLLNKNGIGVSSSDSLALDQFSDVQLVIAGMRLIADKVHQPAKIQMMRRLALLHQFPYEPGRYLTKKKVDFNGFLRDHNLKEWNFDKMESGVYDAIEELILTYLPSGRSAALIAFMEYATQVTGKNGSISAVLKDWDGKTKKPSLKLESRKDSVQVMTIHKSKGLQFKWVIIPQLVWSDGKSGDNKWVNLAGIKHAPLPYAPLPMTQALNQMGLSHIIEQEVAERIFDEINKLYVALTRAEVGMILTYHQRRGKMFTPVQGTVDAIIESYAETRTSHFEELEDEYVELALGKFPIADGEKDVDDQSRIEPAVPKSPWYEKIKIANNDSSEDRELGILFHHIVASSQSLEDAHETVRLKERRFEIEAQSANELHDMLELIFGDKKYESLLKSHAPLFEREIMSNGEVLRPDLVLESSEDVLVIDFKTGGKDEKHKAQVRTYMRSLADLTEKAVEGFVLYVGQGKIEWDKVSGESEPVQGTLF